MGEAANRNRWCAISAQVPSAHRRGIFVPLSLNGSSPANCKRVLCLPTLSACRRGSPFCVRFCPCSRRTRRRMKELMNGCPTSSACNITGNFLAHCADEKRATSTDQRGGRPRRRPRRAPKNKQLPIPFPPKWWRNSRNPAHALAAADTSSRIVRGNCITYLSCGGGGGASLSSAEAEFHPMTIEVLGIKVRLFVDARSWNTHQIENAFRNRTFANRRHVLARNCKRGSPLTSWEQQQSETKTVHQT